MAEATSKAKTEITQVKMEDGRTVGFAGTRKMVKDYTIDESTQTVTAVIDFRNGKTVRLAVTPALRTTIDGQDVPLLFVCAGHGLIQKLGDEAANEKEVDDAYLAVDDLAARVRERGEWRVEREAGGFSGASIVLQAILEAKRETSPDYTMEKVKEQLQAILDKDAEKAAAEGRKPITRQSLYASFRNPTQKVGKIVKRLEEEKALKMQTAGNGDELLEALA